MYRTLLVPLDGSAFGEHALPLALALARRAGASMQLVNIQAPIAAVHAEGPLFLDEALLAQLQARQEAHHQTYLDDVLRRVRASASDLTVSASLLEGDVPGHIRQQAESAKADLVVLATHGRGAMARFWLGSVTDDLIRHATMPLLLVHGSETPVDLGAEASLRHVLIPLDGTPLAEQILPAATEIARLFGADVTLLRVIKPVLTTGYPVTPGGAGEMAYALMDQIDAMQENLKQEARTYLETVAAAVRARGLTVNCQVDVGEAPADAILKDAVPPAIDLVAQETHGRSGLSRMLLGSITERVAHQAAVPVLVHRSAQK